MSEAITDEDRRMINYFIRVTGDITRWSSWEEKREAVKEAYPELIESIARVEAEEETLYAILYKIECEIKS
jgi:hypothetical protein